MTISNWARVWARIAVWTRTGTEASYSNSRIAPTVRGGRRWLRGEVTCDGYGESFLFALPFTTSCRPAAYPSSLATTTGPLHYKLSETVPSTTNGQRALSTHETVSFVTVGVRDSASASIWELYVDSMSNVIVPARGVDAKALNMQVGPIASRRPKSYRATVRDGHVVETVADGKATDYPSSAHRPQWSLIEQLSPLALLPDAGLPGHVGETRVDTSARHTLVPTGVIDDTTIVKWTRRGADQVRGAVTQYEIYKCSPAPPNVPTSCPISFSRTIRVGSVKIVLDPGERVLEARTTLEDGHVTSRYGGGALVRTATLIRVP